jgi:thioesterase domain-containing protein/acyl carrier protein
MIHQGVPFTDASAVVTRVISADRGLGPATNATAKSWLEAEPAETERALLQLPAVAQAVVRVSGTGANAALVAYVVPRGPDLDYDDLRSQLRLTLPEYLVPSRFVRLGRLPLNAHGKVDEGALVKWAPESRHRSTGTMDEAERTVAEMAMTILRADWDIGPSDNFLDDLGGTSLGLIRLLSAIEQRSGRQLEVRLALQDITIAGLAKLLRPEAEGGTSLPVIGEATGGSLDLVPLFIVHVYVGSALNHRRLAPHLRSERVVPIEVHGASRHDRSDQGASSVRELAAEVLAQIKTVQPRGPYLLGGHSAGGMVGFEVARQLGVLGEEVLDLLVIDAPVTRSRLDHVWAEWALNWPELRDASPRELAAMLKGILTSRFRRRATDAHLPVGPNVERATRQVNVAFSHYRPSSYRGRLTLLWTDHGQRMARGRADLGWTALIDGPIDSRHIPGTHNGIFLGDNAAALGAEVDRFATDARKRVADRRDADG